MSLRKVFPQLIDTTGASDGQVLRYVDANAKVEFVTVAAGEGGTSNAVQDNLNRLEANASANVNTVQDNVASASSNLTALDTSVDTVSGNIDSYATYANTTFGAVSGFTFQTIAVGTSGNVVANVASDTLTFTAGNNIVINADASSDSITFKATLSNATNNYFIADGSTNAFTLTESVSANLDILVSVEGLLQSPNLHYSVDSTTLTLMNTLPIESGTEIAVRWIPNTAENVPGIAPSGHNLMGESFGYTAAGFFRSGNNPTGDTRLEKFPFSSDTNATNIGTIGAERRGSSMGTASSTHGYAYGNSGDPSYPIPSGNGANIRKYSFTSDSDGVNVGQLLTSGGFGASTASDSHGYRIGSGTQMEKFPFTSDTNSTSVGTLSIPLGNAPPGRVSPITNNQLGAAQGTSSTTSGYSHGGNHSTPTIKLSSIMKHPFSSDAITAEIAQLVTTGDSLGSNGVSTLENGYRIGGTSGPGTFTSTMEKYPFSSDANASDIGELSYSAFGVSSTQSTTSGYSLGGTSDTNYNGVNNINKFSHSSDVGGTNIGSLSRGRRFVASSQV